MSCTSCSISITITHTWDLNRYTMSTVEFLPYFRVVKLVQVVNLYTACPFVFLTSTFSVHF